MGSCCSWLSETQKNDDIHAQSNTHLLIDAPETNSIQTNSIPAPLLKDISFGMAGDDDDESSSSIDDEEIERLISEEEEEDCSK